MIYNDLFNERLQKVRDCIEFKNEKVVSTFMGQATPPAHYDDFTLADYMDDPERGFDLYLDFMNRINKEAPIECMNQGYPGAHYAGIHHIWWSRVKRPGHELPADSVWQVEERGVITADDYDIIANGGLAEVQNRIMPLVSYDMDEMYKTMQANAEKAPKDMQRYIDAGYPVLATCAFTSPFETLCGGRGMHKFFMDCYKKLDKIKAAQDAMMEGVRAQIAATPVEPHTIGGWVGGWRGASNMVSPKIWNTLVWPYMKEICLLMIDKGLTPIVHLDSCWDRDLERFLELPKQKCIMNPDGMTDMRKAREVLGDHMALMGDVPSSMMAVSSKEEVKDYCRRLIDDIGPKGLFLTAGCDAPSCSKYENLVAIHEVAAEY